MKTLLIIRHAKSSWDNINAPDIDRPLNDRGKKDAPAMAKRVIKAGVHVDRLISSPARRARHTAELFAREFKVKETDIVSVTELYHAHPPSFNKSSPAWMIGDQTVALFSHNPGITVLCQYPDHRPARQYAYLLRLCHQKRCANVERILRREPEFLFFDYPKSATAD